MITTNVPSLVKVDELRKLEKQLDQLRSDPPSLTSLTSQTQLLSAIESNFFAVKSHFNLIKSDLEPESFSICLYFFNWCSKEFLRLRYCVRTVPSQENSKKFFLLARSVILQLARFIGFMEKLDLVVRT
ncbi:MAG: hypothetical protein ACW964_18590 [Candidatus Hodarchaeales archaeon]